MSFTEFYERYFLINLNDYPNIGVDLEINKILFFFLVGLIIASFAVNYFRSNMHTVIKALIRREAYTEGSALTLDELKINSRRIRRALQSGTQLSRIVGRVGETSYTYKEYVKLSKERGFKEDKIDFTVAKFYIRENQKTETDKIFASNSPSVLSTTLFSLLLVAIYICVMLLMPEILTLINNMLA